MTRRLFYTDHYSVPLPPEHRFPIQKYRMLRELLERDGLFAFEPAPLAELETIALAHDWTYMDAFVHGRLSAEAVRRIGFPWSEGLVTRTLASVGSTLAATREALATGWGGTMAGGTHHAFAGEGSGFCVFNDIAVAARWVQTSQEVAELTLGRADEGACSYVGRGDSQEGGSGRRVTRVAVIDLDVHQGDGTAHIFRDEPSVFTLSVHCKNNFPLRKQQSKMDVELDAGVGDAEYLRVLGEVLPRVWEFQPEIVFYQSGVDGLGSDRLGRLQLTHDGLKERDRMVIWGARQLGVPFVITIGGGYAQPIALTAEAHANTFRVAAEDDGYDPRRDLAGSASKAGRPSGT
ncbi:MAG TPA: histone deacetylase [Terriglobales bacterium]|jgi:acetoin utilization deacetylase AcuC-like enzyme|nr:histone deacetylase [Terriglobales bacterium]